mmetsp:Transcript_133674/g.250101  ORF Transcript_133674/g.250101 Transcript_133674/m.250101 type:complete len:123 (-) Transcript_133674:54-422(-)
MGCLSSSAAAASEPASSSKYKGGSSNSDEPTRTPTPNPAPGPAAPGGSTDTSRGIPQDHLIVEEDLGRPDATAPALALTSTREPTPVGLWRDKDGDEAHEFWEEDPKTGKFKQIPASELRKV